MTAAEGASLDLPGARLFVGAVMTAAEGASLDVPAVAVSELDGSVAPYIEEIGLIPCEAYTDCLPLFEHL